MRFHTYFCVCSDFAAVASVPESICCGCKSVSTFLRWIYPACKQTSADIKWHYRHNRRLSSCVEARPSCSLTCFYPPRQLCQRRCGGEPSLVISLIHLRVAAWEMVEKTEDIRVPVPGQRPSSVLLFAGSHVVIISHRRRTKWMARCSTSTQMALKQEKSTLNKICSPHPCSALLNDANTFPN